VIVLTAAAVLAVVALLPGTYSNKEQVYFAKEAEKPAPAWTGIVITSEADGYRMRSVDAYGVATGHSQLLKVQETDKIVSITLGTCSRDYARVARGLTIVNQSGNCTGMATLTTVTEAGLAFRLAGDTVLETQRARTFKCWASIPRKALKDGKTDWWFKQGLMLHDRGGRVMAETDEAVPQRFTLRMRNVVWPSGNNAPSPVLYVHGSDPDHAISYSWTEPESKRVGINLRTMQGSCTRVS
jgi:hypothetical protein